MNTDNNQNKHLTELSDEDLKQVNGGNGATMATDAETPVCFSAFPDGRHCQKYDSDCNCLEYY